MVPLDVQAINRLALRERRIILRPAGEVPVLHAFRPAALHVPRRKPVPEQPSREAINNRVTQGERKNRPIPDLFERLHQREIPITVLQRPELRRTAGQQPRVVLLSRGPAIVHPADHRTAVHIIGAVLQTAVPTVMEVRRAAVITVVVHQAAIAGAVHQVAPAEAVHPVIAGAAHRVAPAEAVHQVTVGAARRVVIAGAVLHPVTVGAAHQVAPAEAVLVVLREAVLQEPGKRRFINLKMLP